MLPYLLDVLCTHADGKNNRTSHKVALIIAGSVTAGLLVTAGMLYTLDVKSCDQPLPFACLAEDQ